MFHFDCRGEDRDLAEGADSSAAARTGRARAERPDGVESERFLEYRSKMTRRMARRLELDPEQTAALEPIVGEAMLRGRGYWVEARDEFCAMQRDFLRQVSELLTSEQAGRFEEMRFELLHPGRRDERPERRNHDGGSCR